MVLEYYYQNKRDEKTTKIILYTKGKRENLCEDIVNFLDYCDGLPPRGDFTKSVANEVEKVKTNEKFKEEHMTLAQELERLKEEWTEEAKKKEGMKEGMKEPEDKLNRKFIANLKAMNFSDEKIAEIGEMTLEQVKAYM